MVRVSYTEFESVPIDFDEKRNRTTGHLQDEQWAEYIVAWRKDKLELYREHVCLSLIASDAIFHILLGNSLVF